LTDFQRLQELLLRIVVAAISIKKDTGLEMPVDASLPSTGGTGQENPGENVGNAGSKTHAGSLTDSCTLRCFSGLGLLRTGGPGRPTADTVKPAAISPRKARRWPP
jgi:hypothetical protein